MKAHPTLLLNSKSQLVQLVACYSLPIEFRKKTKKLAKALMRLISRGLTSSKMIRVTQHLFIVQPDSSRAKVRNLGLCVKMAVAMMKAKCNA